MSKKWHEMKRLERAFKKRIIQIDESPPYDYTKVKFQNSRTKLIPKHEREMFWWEGAD